MQTALIAFGALARLLPHLPNFTPIGAMALYGGAYGSRRTALLAPLAALALSDVLIGGHATLPWVYASFLLIGLLGMRMFRSGVTTPRLVGASLASSSILFVVSNFGVWMSGSLYAPTLQGLVTCYAMALPYFWNTMLGDLFFVGVMFGCHQLVARRVRRAEALAIPASSAPVVV